MLRVSPQTNKKEDPSTCVATFREHLFAFVCHDRPTGIQSITKTKRGISSPVGDDSDISISELLPDVLWTKTSSISRVVLLSLL